MSLQQIINYVIFFLSKWVILFHSWSQTACREQGLTKHGKSGDFEQDPSLILPPYILQSQTRIGALLCLCSLSDTSVPSSPPTPSPPPSSPSAVPTVTPLLRTHLEYCFFSDLGFPARHGGQAPHFGKRWINMSP